MYNIDIHPRLQSTLYQINLDQSIFPKHDIWYPHHITCNISVRCRNFGQVPPCPGWSTESENMQNKKSLKNQNTVKHLFMQTTRDDENSSSIAIPIACSLCPSNFHFFGGSLPSRYPVLRRQSHPMLPHGLPWGKNGGTFEWCVKSVWHIFYIWPISPPSSSIPINLFVLFTFLYQDQQVVPRHRGKLRCTLAARRASPL